MLVLERRERESVVIQVAGEVIWVNVCRIDEGSVKLGFDADKTVLIDREEVYRKSLKEKRE